MTTSRSAQATGKPERRAANTSTSPPVTTVLIESGVHLDLARPERMEDAFDGPGKPLQRRGGAACLTASLRLCDLLAFPGRVTCRMQLSPAGAGRARHPDPPGVRA